MSAIITWKEKVNHLLYRNETRINNLSRKIEKLEKLKKPKRHYYVDISNVLGENVYADRRFAHVYLTNYDTLTPDIYDKIVGDIMNVYSVDDIIIENKDSYDLYIKSLKQ